MKGDTTMKRNKEIRTAEEIKSSQRGNVFWGIIGLGIAGVCAYNFVKNEKELKEVEAANKLLDELTDETEE